jgi:hypothetical protein
METQVKTLITAVALGGLIVGPALVHAALALATFFVVPTLIFARCGRPLGRSQSQRGRLVLAADNHANIKVQA